MTLPPLSRCKVRSITGKKGFSIKPELWASWRIAITLTIGVLSVNAFYQP